MLKIHALKTKALKTQALKLSLAMRLVFALLFICATFTTNAADKRAFLQWQKAFKAEAKLAGISDKTIQATFKSAQFLPQVIVLDRAQPEFISPFFSYINNRVNTNQINLGRALLHDYDNILTPVEAQYGVPKEVLVAFWGLETHYGANKGNFGLPSSLMTLAYEGRRAAFFRGQLLDAMRIVDAGHNTVAGMRGSWAGAMGNMQFMPSTMLKHGVDADGDDRIDIWTSLPDSFASAANYLNKAGWQKDEIAMLEVKLPSNFNYNLAQLQNRKSAYNWERLGVTAMDDQPLPAQDNAAILLPQGWQGPVFMVFTNFDVILDWNRSVNYALSVAHLANQYVADKPIIAGADAENEALTFNQMWALQGKLNELGFDCGAPDGLPGLATQAAIRQYQAAEKLPQDGYASASLYHLLFQIH